MWPTTTRPSHPCIVRQSNTKKHIGLEDWQRRLREVKVRKEDMNRVVMNFLVTEVRVGERGRSAVQGKRPAPARCAGPAAVARSAGVHSFRCSRFSWGAHSWSYTDMRISVKTAVLVVQLLGQACDKLMTTLCRCVLPLGDAATGLRGRGPRV